MLRERPAVTQATATPAAPAISAKNARNTSAPVFVTSSEPGVFDCPQSVGAESNAARRAQPMGAKAAVTTTRRDRPASTAQLGLATATRSNPTKNPLSTRFTALRYRARVQVPVPRQAVGAEPLHFGGVMSVVVDFLNKSAGCLESDRRGLTRPSRAGLILIAALCTIAGLPGTTDAPAKGRPRLALVTCDDAVAAAPGPIGAVYRSELALPWSTRVIPVVHSGGSDLPHWSKVPIYVAAGPPDHNRDRGHVARTSRHDLGQRRRRKPPDRPRRANPTLHRRVPCR